MLRFVVKINHDRSKLRGVITLFGTTSYLYLDYSITFQLTEDGATGVNGAHAPPGVLEALNNALESATTLLLKVLVRIARGMLPELRVVMRT